MKKLGFSIVCIFVFAVTLLLLFPRQSSASPWYCFWIPWDVCHDDEGISAVVECDDTHCPVVGEPGSICLYCQK